MTDALLVKPFATEESGDAIRRAIEVSAAEKRTRIQRLGRQVAERNFCRWARDPISQTLHVARGPAL